jgi:MFS family permease
MPDQAETAAVAGVTSPKYPPPPPVPPLFPNWPAPTGPATRRSLLAAGAVGVIGAALLPWSAPGAGWLATGLAVTAALMLSDRPRPTPMRPMWTVGALLCVAVPGLRAAGWLDALAVIGALACGSAALSNGHTGRGLAVGIGAVPIASGRALRWATRGAALPSGLRPRRLLAAIVTSIALLATFGALFAGADPVFAKLVNVSMPTVDGQATVRWIASFLVMVPVTLGGAFLLASTPSVEAAAPPRRSWRGLEWALPVGALVGLFAAFVAVEATVLFGGADHVLSTEGLTFAQYARGGFWQLLAATALTLLIMAVVARKAVRETASDRVWLRGLLGALALLSLVIVASALGRMWTYEQAYGFSRLRLLVSACETWLGVIFLLIIAAGVRMSAPWLPRAVAASAVLTLLVLAALNPDRFIADHNIDRYATTGRLDLAYLSTLSVDAVPALQRLPEPERSCMIAAIVEHERSHRPPGLRGWTLSGFEADRVVGQPVPCPPPGS